MTFEVQVFNNLYKYPQMAVLDIKVSYICNMPLDSRSYSWEQAMYHLVSKYKDIKIDKDILSSD